MRVITARDEKLIEAVIKGDAADCKSLLEVGANPNIVISLPVPPLYDLPREMGSYGLFKYEGDPQNTVLIEAVKNNQLAIVQLLIQHGAKLDIQNLNGATALMKAAKNGHLEILNLLIAEGSDLDLKAYSAAAKVENGIQKSIHRTSHPINEIRFSRVTGELTEDSDILGMNALDIALKFKNLEAADLLLRNGAQPSAQPPQAVSNTMLTQHAYGHYDVESGEVRIARQNRSCSIS